MRAIVVFHHGVVRYKSVENITVGSLVLKIEQFTCIIDTNVFLNRSSMNNMIRKLIIEGSRKKLSYGAGSRMCSLCMKTK